MTEADYALLCALVRKRSGLALGPEKRYLVESRLAPILKSAGFGNLTELASALRRAPAGPLLAAVADALATHETFFFRDRPVFDALRDVVLPGLQAKRPGKPIRIWSAASSTGQEAYSLAMIASELRTRSAASPIEILGTDMVPSVIDQARAGLYSQMEVQRGLPIRSLLQHFTQDGLHWRISAELRRLVQFKVFNLLDDFEPLGRFDVILCRNVLIYLDAASKRALLDRLAPALAPGGVLCLGGTETLTGITSAFRPHDELRSLHRRADEWSCPTASSLKRRA